MSGFSLYQRGLLLVLFPLVCQIIFVASLTVLLSKLEAEVVREDSEKELIGKTFHFGGQGMMSAYLLMVEAKRGDLFGLSDQSGATAVKQFKTALEEIKTVPVLTKEQDDRRTKLIEASNDLLREFERMPKNVHSTLPVKQRAESLFPTIKSLHKFLDATAALVAQEELAIRNSPVLSTELRAITQQTLLTSVALSILIAVCLAYDFSRRVKLPLSLIAENSRRLSNNEQLLPPLKGRDELTQVDKLLHMAAQALSEAQIKERLIVENVAELICSIDKNGCFSQANSYSKRLLGLDPELLINRSLFDFVPIEDHADLHLQLDIAFNSTDLHLFEIKLNGEDGVIDSRWSSFWSDANDSLFCAVHDNTEEKKIERLKKEFFDMISEDLRSPLDAMHDSMTRIASSTEGEASAQIRAEAHEAAMSLELLTVFVNDLLEFQNIKDGKVKVTIKHEELSSILNDAVDLLQSLATSKQIYINVQNGSWTVACDRRRLLQALVNILSNAIKFSPENSVIDINVVESNEEIELIVSDCGPGVPAELANRIFDPFEQISPARGEGSGLGLSICKMIVQAHAGSVGVRPRLTDTGDTKGSEFWIRLPVSAESK